METPKSSFVRLQDLLGKDPLDPAEGKERGHLKLIGIVTFNKGKQLVKLIEEEDGTLHSRYEETPEGFHKSKIIDGKGRVLSFDDFDNVNISQIGINDKVTVETHPTSQTYPSVYVEFTYTDPSDQTKKTFPLDEEDILDVFTNKSGGHAIFSGSHLHPLEALVIEQEAKDTKEAFLFLFQPEALGAGATSWAGSGEGLRLFLKRLNHEFLERSDLPLQREWVAVLDEALANGLLESSLVRKELFKTVLIAHARKAASTGEKEYLEFLDLCFSEVLESNRLKPFGKKKTKRSVNLSTINKSMDRMVIKDKEGENGDIEELTTAQKLKTEKARLIRDTFPEVIGENPATQVYLSGLVDLLNQFKGEAEFRDLELLLKEVQEKLVEGKVAFNPCSANFDMDVQEDKKFCIRFDNGGYWGGEKLLETFRAAAVKRRNHLIQSGEYQTAEIVPAKKEEVKQDVKSLLKTQIGKDIYEYASDGGNRWGESMFHMQGAANKIWKIIKKSKNIEELQDMRTLLTAMRQTPFGKIESNFYRIGIASDPLGWLFRVPVVEDLESYSEGYHIHGSKELIDELLYRLDEKE